MREHAAPEQQRGDVADARVREGDARLRGEARLALQVRDAREPVRDGHGARPRRQRLRGGFRVLLHEPHVGLDGGDAPRLHGVEHVEHEVRRRHALGPRDDVRDVRVVAPDHVEAAAAAVVGDAALD